MYMAVIAATNVTVDDHSRMGCRRIFEKVRTRNRSAWQAGGSGLTA
jgi:hypothetical protein